MNGQATSLRWMHWTPSLLLAIGGIAFGGFMFALFGRPLMPVEVLGDPLQMNAVYRTALVGALVVTMISAIAILAAGLLPSLETWHRLVLAAIGLGFLLSGWVYQITHRIEIREDSFSVRSFGAFWSRSFELGNGNKVEVDVIARPFSRFGDHRSAHYRHRDGSREVLCGNLRFSRLWSFAYPHLLRGTKVVDTGVPN